MHLLRRHAQPPRLAKLQPLGLWFLLLAATTSMVDAFSSGPGGCAGNNVPAVNGFHLDAGTDGTRPVVVTSLADAELAVTVNGVPMDDDAAGMEVAVGEDVIVAIAAMGEAFRGILIRLEVPDGMDSLATITFGENTAVAGACRTPIQGVGHEEPGDKTGASGILRFDEAMDDVILDVTVVIANDANQSVYAFTRYVLTVNADSSEAVETAEPTPAPITDAPVVAPTDTPVVSPTDAPVVSPTNAPVPSPTERPAVAPTDAPVVSPTSAPVPSPTDMPIVAPTDAPVASETSAPVVAPTDAPVTRPLEPPPTNSPVVTPTEAPVTSPTDPPVISPTDSPVVTPTVTVGERPTPTTDTQAPIVSTTDIPTAATTSPIDSPVAVPTGRQESEALSSSLSVSSSMSLSASSSSFSSSSSLSSSSSISSSSLSESSSSKRPKKHMRIHG